MRWLFCYGIASYLVIAFEFRRFEKFNYVHSNLYYIGHWILPLATVIVTLLPKVRRPKLAATNQGTPDTATSKSAIVTSTKPETKKS